ncbi:septal ring lytic transglycosylase RlpA family protein [Actinomadura barringtoniae]|nr:septal ring lytic transglycosylase RlpA family protein [Actinomadura barringtoniae]
MTTVTGSCLAGILVAGVALANDDDAPKQKKTPTELSMMAAQKQATDAKAQQAAQAQAQAKAQAQKEKAAAAKKAEEAKKKAEAAKKAAQPILTGKTTASYFWDDGSGINGDTGAPASGEPMQKGLFASPSWPLGTKVKVTYKGRSITGFVGDRGPGAPSSSGVMLDLDTYTFRYLLDGGKPDSDYDAGTGEGHLQGVKWEVLKWGTGAGTRGEPQAM